MNRPVTTGLVVTSGLVVSLLVETREEFGPFPCDQRAVAGEGGEGEVYYKRQLETQGQLSLALRRLGPILGLCKSHIVVGGGGGV